MDMKPLFAILLGCLFFLGSVAPGNAQMLIYPKEGQSKTQQDRDEFECYKWAKEKTGVDPATQGQTQPQAPAVGGEIIRGGARGAALGAVGGAIGGDAGKGAKIGAGVGATAGLLQRRRNRIRQQESQTQQSQAGNSYNRAYSVCLKGRGYEVD